MRPWVTWKPTATRNAPGRSAFQEAVPCGSLSEIHSHRPARGTTVTARTSSHPSVVRSRSHQVSEITAMKPLQSSLYFSAGICGFIAVISLTWWLRDRTTLGWLLVLAETDVALKSSRRPADAVLESMLTRLCRNDAPRRRFDGSPTRP